MRDIATIVFGVTGQALLFQSLGGAPSAATFAAFRDTATDDSTPEFSGAATLDTVATTTGAAAGPSQANPQRVPLTSTAGVAAGRRYLLAEAGRREWVDVVEVGAGYALARHPVISDYTAAATFVGTTISAAVPDAWAAATTNLGNPADPAPRYRCRWAMTVGAEQVIAYSYFDLARADIVPSVQISDVNARAPGLKDSLPTEYRIDEGRTLLAEAWRAVRLDVARSGVDTLAIRNDEVLNELVILRCLRMLAEGGWRPMNFDVQTYLQLTATNYATFYAQHVLPITTMAVDTTGAVGEKREVPVWRK